MVGDKGTATALVNAPNAMSPATSITAVLTPPSGESFATIKFALTPTAQQLDPAVTKTTKLIVTGNETGGRIVVPISIVNDINANRTNI